MHEQSSQFQRPRRCEGLSANVDAAHLSQWHLRWLRENRMLAKAGIIRQCGEPMLDHACKHVPAKKRCVALCGAHGGRGGRACWWEVSWWEPEERRPRGAISPEDWCAPSPALLPKGAAGAARARAPNSPDPDAACSRFSASELPCCFLRRWRATRPQHSFWPDMLQIAHRCRTGRLLLIFSLCHTNGNCMRKPV